MKLPTTELSGIALDWAVAQIDPQCEGLTFAMVDGLMCGFFEDEGVRRICIFLEGPNIVRRLRARKKMGEHATAYYPSHDWSVSGPMIEREHIQINEFMTPQPEMWVATIRGKGGTTSRTGSTPLIAAMRALVTVRMGERVEVPDELVGSEESHLGQSVKPDLIRACPDFQRPAASVQ